MTDSRKAGASGRGNGPTRGRNYFAEASVTRDTAHQKISSQQTVSGRASRSSDTACPKLRPGRPHIWALFALLWLGMASAAQAVTVINSLPFEADIAGETYVINSNLNSSSSGIYITADNVVIQGNGRHLTGANGNIFHLYNADGVVISDLTFQWTNASKTLVLERSSNNTITNISGVGSGVAMWHCSGNEIVDCDFDGVNGAGARLTIGLNELNSADACAVRNSTFHMANDDFDQMVWFSYGSNCEIEDCSFVLDNANNHEIMQLQQSHYNTFRRNQFYINGSGRVSIRSQSSYNLFEENEVYCQSGQGLWQVGGGSNNTYRSNIVFCQDQGMRFSEGSKDNLVEGNLIVAPGTTVLVDASTQGGNRLYNNTLVNTGTSSNAQVMRIKLAAGRDFQMRNNVLYSVNARAINAEDATWTGFDTDYNLYYQEDPQDYLIRYQGTSYSSLASFRSATGEEQHGLQTDPQLVNVTGDAGGNYTLSASSPAIDAGDPSFPVPPGGGSTIDIGYAEYSSGGGPSDEVSPATVTTLNATGVTTSTVSLQWTAVGDDNFNGQASAYDLRYSTSPITSGNWNSATQVSGEPLPRPSGQSESFTVGNLSSATTYYFAIKVADEVPNWSGVSNVVQAQTETVVGTDTTAPSAPLNFAVTGATESTVSLFWRAPGDDGLIGQASAYALRLSASPINEGNWGSATPVPGVPAPSPSGTLQNFTVTGLTAETTYYFGIKAVDEAGNWSGLATVSGTTEAGEIPGDPSLEGFGAGTAGGIGGTPYVVTSLANSGPGTLRDAVSQSNRMITFSVGGTIYLNSSIPVLGHHLTIDGSSAPQPGITITAATPSFEGALLDLNGSVGTPHDIVLRHLRFRDNPDDEAGDNLRINGSGAYGIVVDHCSFRRAGDGNIDITDGAHDITVQWCILADADQNNLLRAVNNITIHHNLYVHGLKKNPRVRNGTSPADVRNNVIYNWGPEFGVQFTAGGAGNLVNNYFKSGFQSNTSAAFLVDPSAGSVYVSGNTVPTGTSNSGNTGSPHAAPAVTTTSAGEAFNSVLTSAGAAPRDADDSQYVFETLVGGGIDSSPPNAITNLAIQATTDKSVTLRWTAPGDNGSSGTAATYDVRYSTSPITTSNWGFASQATGEPAPLVAGTTQSFTVAGLQPSTTYYFAMKTADEVPNWSALSNVLSATTHVSNPGGDGVAPSPVNNLSVLAQSPTTITLNWTATGDDGNTGQATYYDLRFDTVPINAGNWDAADQVINEIPPGNPGANQIFTIGGLQHARTYYFALKVGDEVPNWSPLSNIAQGTTEEGATEDNVAPNAVDDLEAIAVEPSRVHLKWAATGDDGFSGNADHYELRFNQALITEANWDSSTAVLGLPNPGSPGSAQYTWVNDLTAGAIYYFGIRVHDEAGNVSEISNVLEVETPTEVDTIPPDVIDDLGGDTDGPTSIRLTWTAPGDDDGTPVAVYEIRVQSSPIPDVGGSALRTGAENEGSPVIVEVEPAALHGGPLDPGSLEEYVVGSLAPGTLYYARVRSRDHAGNWAQLSNQVEVTTEEEVVDPPDGTDSTPPAGITDLRVHEVGVDFATLLWTATGDDGLEGTADSIDVRVATAFINELNWPLAASVPGIQAPHAGGEPETLRVEGLWPGQDFYFAVRAFDEQGNASLLSNVPSVTTEFNPDIAAPEAVLDLAAIDSTVTSITVQFTAPADVVSEGAEGPGAVVEYDLRMVLAGATLNDETWADANPVTPPAPAVPGAVVSHVVAGLTASTEYTFGMRSLDDAGNWSAISNLASARTSAPPPDPDTTPPAPITDVRFEALDPWTGNLLWTAVGADSLDGQATAYDIRRLAAYDETPPDPSAPGAWDEAEVVAHSLVPQSSGGAESLALEDLVAQAIYTFGIRAIDDAGNQGEVRWSDAVQMPSSEDNLAPNGITDLGAVAIDTTSVFLQWTAPADPQPYLDVTAVARYVVRWTSTPLNDANWESFAGEATIEEAATPGSGESFQLHALTPGTTYFFGIRSFDAAGNRSALSNVVFVEMPSPDPNDPNDPNDPQPDTTAPSSVNSLVGYAIGIDGIHLSWLSVGDDGNQGTAAQYEFRYASSQITAANWNTATVIAGVPAPAAAGHLENFDWTGLTPGTTYHVALKVIDEEGNTSGLSNPVSVTTPEFQDSSPPAIPSLIWAEFTDDAVVVHWNPSGDLDLAGYQVHRRTSGVPGLLILSEHWTSNSFVDDTAVAGETYAYSVAARDVNGNLSGRSTEVQITVPSAPTLAFEVEEQGADPVDPNRDRVLLYWEVSGAVDVQGFHVYRERVGGVDHQPSPSDPIGPRERITDDLVTGSQERFLFVENPLPEPGYYRYWVEAWGFAGGTRFLEDPIGVLVPEWQESVIGLYPNPMFDRMTVAFSLPEPEDVRVSIYAASGRVVHTAVESNVSAGRHEWTWDGITASGERVATGTYFMVFQAGSTMMREKLVVLR